MKVEKIKKAFDDVLLHKVREFQIYGLILAGYSPEEARKMKVEKIKKQFEPITITLESRRELICLECALSLARNDPYGAAAVQEFCENLSNELGILWLPEAMKNTKDETIKR